MVGLGAGSVRLRASASDTHSAPIGLELTVGQGRRGVDLHLGGEIVLRGRIVDGAQGPAVAGARVAVDVPMDQLGLSSTSAVTTGADGSFELGPVSEGRHTVVALAPTSTAGSRRVEVQASVDDLEFELGQAGTIHGEYWLTAVASGRAPSTTARPMRVGGGVGGRVDFRLGEGGGLWVQVRDAADRPAAGRQVRLGRVLDGAEPDGPALPSADWAPPRTTDGDGVVQVRLLEPGLYSVWADGRPPAGATARVQDGRTTSVTLEAGH
jgi:hypothetical protein